MPRTRMSGQPYESGHNHTIISGNRLTDCYKQMLADGETPQPTNRFERRRLRDVLKAIKNGAN